MLKKTITYTDYNGEERTEDFYFNLNKVECMELEFSVAPGETLSNSIQTLVNAQDMGTVIATIKKIVLMAYGVKSPDGKKFVKNQRLREEFEQTPAFEQLYWDLITDSNSAADFLSGVMPSAVRDSLGNDPKRELLNRMKAFEQANK